MRTWARFNETLSSTGRGRRVALGGRHQGRFKTRDGLRRLALRLMDLAKAVQHQGLQRPVLRVGVVVEERAGTCPAPLVVRLWE